MSKIFRLRSIIIASLIFIPFTTFALINGSEVSTGFEKIGGLVSTFTKSIVGALAVLALTLGVVAFFWGVVEYIWGLRAGDATKEKNGRNFMLWGLIALFVMFSVWGIVRYAQRIFEIEGQNTILIPDIRFEGGSGSNNIRSDGTGINSPLDTGSPFNRKGNGSVVGGTPTGKLPSGYGSVATQTVANQAYSSCKNQGGNASQCQAAYQSAGGAGSGMQNNANKLYNACVARNGVSSAQCQATYAAAGGSGSGAQNLAQEAYSTCLGNGNTSAECMPAYKAYGGTGTPATEANSNGVCPSGYIADNEARSGCSPVSTLGGTNDDRSSFDQYSPVDDRSSFDQYSPVDDRSSFDQAHYSPDNAPADNSADTSGDSWQFDDSTQDCRIGSC